MRPWAIGPGDVEHRITEDRGVIRRIEGRNNILRHGPFNSGPSHHRTDDHGETSEGSLPLILQNTTARTTATAASAAPNSSMK